MDFRQLETFVEVANSKSFSKAAEKLYITQPTVTNHIQNLEKEIGTILLNRLGKTITLTDAGSLLYKYAINILNSCKMAKFDLASYQGIIQGHLQIYASSVPRKYFLPSIIGEFSKEYPKVKFTLGDRDSQKVISGILNGETDFGILGAIYPSKNIEYIELLEDKLVLITPNNDQFPSENFSYVDRDILLKHKLILREEGSGTRSIVEDTIEKSELSMNMLDTIAYVEDTETITELVSLGVGVSFLSEKAVKSGLLSGKYKVFYIKDLEFKRSFYFAYHKSRQLSPLSDTFKNFILKIIEDQNNK